MANYEPEMGQACFGQPWKTYGASEMLDAAVERIAREWERAIGNRVGHNVSRPFNNSGTIFDTDGLSVHAYSWDDESEQPWNLKCGDVEISWYKHSWRGLSVNKEMPNDEIAAFLESALAALRPCDTGFEYDKRPSWKPFTLNGIVHDEKSYDERCERGG